MVVDGCSCPGCGLENYQGLCPVCRGDEDAALHELGVSFVSPPLEVRTIKVRLRDVGRDQPRIQLDDDCSGFV
jgi:hypothetical protein